MNLKSKISKYNRYLTNISVVPHFHCITKDGDLSRYQIDKHRKISIISKSPTGLTLAKPAIPSRPYYFVGSFMLSKRPYLRSQLHKLPFNGISSNFYTTRSKQKNKQVHLLDKLLSTIDLSKVKNTDKLNQRYIEEAIFYGFRDVFL